MIRLLFILIVAGLVAVGAAWLADNDGVLTIVIAGYEVSMSAAFAAFLLFVAAAVLAGVMRLVFFVLGGPGRFNALLAGRRARRGFQSLSRGLVAAAAGDTREATQSMRKSEKLLGPQPLVLLLQAQAAQLAGNEEQQDAVYRAMLTHPEMEFLGLRGLYALAMRHHNDEQALSFATRAHSLRPQAAGAASALFDLRVARHEWREAEALVAQGARAKILTADIARRRRAVLLAAQAVEADNLGDADALNRALEALALAPSLTPAALIAAHHLVRDGRAWRAQDIIEAAWAQAPHPELAEAYAAIRPDDDRDARTKRLIALAKLNPNHRESRLLLAAQAIAGKNWADARAALAPLAEDHAGIRVCSLMAELAQGEDDLANAQLWRTRAARAARDAQWRCARCGWASPAWAPTCPNCGTFDALSWSTRSAKVLESRSREAVLTGSTSVAIPREPVREGMIVDATPRVGYSAPQLPPERVEEKSAATANAFPRAPDDPGPAGQFDIFESETDTGPDSAADDEPADAVPEADDTFPDADRVAGR